MKLPLAVNVDVSPTLVTLDQLPVTSRPLIVTTATGVCDEPVYVRLSKSPTVAPLILSAVTASVALILSISS